MYMYNPAELTSQHPRAFTAARDGQIPTELELRLYGEPGGNRLLGYVTCFARLMRELSDCGVKTVKIKVAGSSAGAWLAAMIANEWPPDLMLKASIEAMHHGRWNLKLSDVFGLPFGLGLSVNLVPIVRQSLSSIEVKYDLRLEPKPDLGIDACDKDSGRPFRWTGHYDIAEALASACAHCSLAMPVEARQIDGKTLQLVDGVHGPSPVQHAVTPTVRFGPPETQWISRRSAVPGPFNCWGLMGGNGSNPDDLRFPNEADNVVWALVGMSDAVKRIELLDYCLTSREIDALCADGEAAGSKAAEELIPMLTATASAYASPCAVH